MKPLPAPPWHLVAALGVTQIIAWGSIYYAFALLIQPLAEAVGTRPTVVVGAFSVALLVSGLASSPVGSLVDRYGGRAVMAGGSLLAAVLLALLGQVHSVWQLYAVWAGLGLAMAATLYDPAFAVLTQVFGPRQRQAITVLTLFGGLASTVFWPLTQALVAAIGWQQAVLVLAGLNLLVCVPLHAALLPAAAPASPGAMRRADAPEAAGGLRHALRDPVFWTLALAFTGNALVFSAMSVHLLGVLQAKGLDARTAAWVGAMVGPMQVLGRVLEATWLRRQAILRVGMVAMWLLPTALALLLVPTLSWAWLALFALAYGTGNGVMTIVRGAVPRELYGQHGYGAVNGALATPVLLAKAAGPMLAAVLLAGGSPVGVLAVLAAVSALAAAVFSRAVLRAVPARPPPAPAAPG